nr:DEAD/DEAH box helicase [Prevotella sp.]
MDINKIIDKLGIETNPMQKEVANEILHSGKDLIILSPTGSGKTLAYMLPLVQLLDSSKDTIQAIIIVPGRELALQSSDVLSNMGSGFRAMPCYGGRPTMDEHRVMRQINPQIVFGTPGRLNDHIDKGNIKTDDIKYIIIDEFDKCLEMGFHDEMKALLNKIPANSRKILLSATPAEEMKEQNILNSRFSICNFLDKDEQVPERIHIYKVESPEKDKLDSLCNLLLTLGDESSIVFLNFRDSVERTDEFLRKKGFSTSAFHGGMEQKKREDALYKFSNGSTNIFVSTDLASRGLDIANVNNIIHYHLPESEDGYIHRVGRTARWDKQGKAFFILGPQESIPEYVDADIDEYSVLPEAEGKKPASPKMATIYIGKGKKDKISKGDIVGFLCKKGGLVQDEIGKIDIKDRYCYVAITRSKLQHVIKSTQGEKIKGIRTIIEQVN